MQGLYPDYKVEGTPITDATGTVDINIIVDDGELEANASAALSIIECVGIEEMNEAGHEVYIHNGLLNLVFNQPLELKCHKTDRYEW